MTTRLRRRLQAAANDGEEGSALILALMVILMGSLLLGVALDFAKGGLTVAPKARDLRNETTYLQGAADAAINSIRGSSALGRVGGPSCPTYTAPAAASGFLGATGKSFTVTCTPQTVTGVGAIDQPDFAIQTLGTAAGEGINQINNGHTLVVDGGIYSRGVIAGGTGPNDGIDDLGSVYSEKTCVGVTTTDTTGLHCGYPGPSGSSTFGADPAYLASITDGSDLSSLIGPDSGAQAALGADPVPTCSSATSPMIEFYQGYYSETPEALVAGVTGCQGASTGTTYHFNPGRYYFNYGSVWNPSASKKLKLLGGTLSSGYSGGDPLGGACNTAQPGVQIVFGGATQIIINNKTQWEMCGPTTAQAFTGSPQHIVFYGLSSNANNNAAASEPAAVTDSLAASGNPSTSSPGFSPIAFAKAINGSFATFAPAAKNKTATLSYGGFAHVPKGARVSSVQIRVAQTLIGASSTVRVTPATSGVAPFDVALPGACTAGCLVDVTSSFLGHGPAWRHVNSVSLAYSATTSTDVGTVAVDGLELVVGYSTPALVRLSCPGAGCATFDSSDNNAVYFHGTVYAPSAKLAVEVFNSSINLFDRGIIVRTLDVSVSSSSKQTTSPFQIPGATPQGRLVLFRGYVDGTEALRACVAYTDKLGGLAEPGARVAVKHWSVFPVAGGAPSCA
jgi:hypothetical protein